MELESKIEGLLFVLSEPTEIKKISHYLKVSENDIKEALVKLQNNLNARGIVLLEENNMLALGTSPELSQIIEDIKKEELNKELSKASLETLAIILYKDGATRSDIDYIRGVNSSFILRNLSVRGLIDREIDPNDSRRFVYKVTLDALRYLGVTGVGDMPEFSNYKQMLDSELGGVSKLENNNEQAD